MKLKSGFSTIEKWLEIADFLITINFITFVFSITFEKKIQLIFF